jgi:hypothetical protein
MSLVKLYLYHLVFRLQWLKDKLLHNKKLDVIHRNISGGLYSQYESVAGDIPYKEKMKNRECKVFSQNGEDGLLLYIFSQVGITNKTIVEFGVETGRECNAANLLINFSWNGLLMDGSAKNIASGINYYRDIGRFGEGQPKFRQCFITVDNINEVIAENKIEGEIDLLSVDIDGNDYWVWEAINIINPRVVVAEYNASFGPDRAISVKYDPVFTRFSKHKSGWYHGVSISALEKLANNMGYQLVCAESNGCNAFFVRNDVISGGLEVLSAAEAYYPQPKRNLIASLDEQFSMISHLEYIEV